MTLNIITSHRDGLVLAADRRVFNRIIHPELKYYHYVGIFYDGFQKVHSLKPPHNFVGFVMFGNGAVELDVFMEEFEEVLPNTRLNILEYARKLKDFLIEKNAENNYPDHVSVAGHKSNIAVAGYDKNQNLGRVVKFCPEENSDIEDLISGGEEKTVCGGDTRYVQIGNNFYYKTLLEDLKHKHLGLRKIGLSLSRNESQLINSLVKGRDFRPFVTLSMLTDLAKTVIEQTAYEQIRRDEFPMVGDTVDILTITQREGAKFVIHNVEEEGYLRLVDTNKHNIFFRCCSEGVYFQIDFDEEKSLSSNFKRYPLDGAYNCPICDKKHDLCLLREILNEEFSDSES